MFINCDKERSSLSASFLNSCNKSGSIDILIFSFKGLSSSKGFIFFIINQYNTIALKLDK